MPSRALAATCQGARFVQQRRVAHRRCRPCANLTSPLPRALSQAGEAGGAGVDGGGEVDALVQEEAQQLDHPDLGAASGGGPASPDAVKCGPRHPTPLRRRCSLAARCSYHHYLRTSGIFLLVVHCLRLSL